MAPNRFDHLIEHWDRRLRSAFMQAVQDIKDQAHVEQIVRMLQAGNIEGALRAIGLDPALFRIWNKTFEQAFEGGGLATASALPVRLDHGFRVNFRFDVRNQQAESWLRSHSSQFVTEVLNDQR